MKGREKGKGRAKVYGQLMAAGRGKNIFHSDETINKESMVL